MNIQTIRDLVEESMESGVIGMNFRNRMLVEALNPISELAVARDKVATKKRLTEAGVTVPETIAVIDGPQDIKPTIQLLADRGTPFVVKPANSARGRGILLCLSADKNSIIKLSGDSLSHETLIFHFYQILHGEFSFGRPHDTVLIEELLQTDRHWIFPDLPGPPDLRIILCMDQVIMAMARLPTRASDGRANLHCGAVGVGIDLETGITCGGILNDKVIEEHPDSGIALEGHVVDDFKASVKLALKCRKAFNLGFMGIDLMRDVMGGPVVLEVNGRPGLGLQVANRKGLFESTPV